MHKSFYVGVKNPHLLGPWHLLTLISSNDKQKTCISIHLEWKEGHPALDDPTKIRRLGSIRDQPIITTDVNITRVATFWDQSESILIKRIQKIYIKESPLLGIQPEPMQDFAF